LGEIAQVNATDEPEKDPAPPRANQRKKKPTTATQAEELFRLRVVEQAIMDGKRGGQIIELFADLHNRTISANQLTRYMGMVRDKWEAEDSLLRPMWRERQIRKLHDIAGKLETLAAWSHWIAVQKLIADLEGNNAPLKVEQKTVDEFDGWSLEQLREFVKSEGETEFQRAHEGRRGNGQDNRIWSTGPETIQ